MSGEHAPEQPEPAAPATPLTPGGSTQVWREGLVPADAPGSAVDPRDTVALVVGALAGLLVGALDIAVWWAVDNASTGGWMLSAIVWGVPLAILLLVVCGAITRRFRLWLVAVGGFLFASPWIGLGVSLLLR